MEALAIYILKVHLCITLFYTIFHFTVRKEQFLGLNRLILLAVLVLGFSLPLLPEISTEKLPLSHHVQGLFDSTLSTKALAEQLKGKEIAKLPDDTSIDMLSFFVNTLVILYLLPCWLLLKRFLDQIWSVLYLIKNSDSKVEYGVKYHDPLDDTAAFSFFSHIVISRAKHNKEHFKLILAHEKAHVNQWHSLDVIFIELAATILWCNPILKVLKDTARLNLEFLADREVLERGFDKKKYQWCILMPYINQTSYPLANLFKSKPGMRIEKINEKPGPKLKLFKYVIFLPAILFIYLQAMPFELAAFQKLYKRNLIHNHELGEYLGYYEFVEDRGSFIEILMKDEQLVMKTLWNNEKIYFEKQDEGNFTNEKKDIQISFKKNFEGKITEFVAFGKDHWTKVNKIKPVEKRYTEGMALKMGADGVLHVSAYPVDPWQKVRRYIPNP
ncbi:M56 family metallopeptidase [Desertivirga brevis]|uniref:M56 family metallopeptidase n=1 Tax=Desertivirga brevis TaxID=2810310 RepID=UPI001A95875F|nr:M56 family metallopeptidase [Pedobacter sp. SYSU D00873]